MPDISDLIEDFDTESPRAQLLADFLHEPDNYIGNEANHQKLTQTFYYNPLYRSADPLFSLCLYAACTSTLEEEEAQHFGQAVRTHLTAFTKMVDVDTESCAERIIPVMRTAYRAIAKVDEREFSHVFKVAARAFRRLDTLFPDAGTYVSDHRAWGDSDEERETLKLAGFIETPRGYALATPEPGMYIAEDGPDTKGIISLE